MQHTCKSYAVCMQYAIRSTYGMCKIPAGHAAHKQNENYIQNRLGAHRLTIYAALVETTSHPTHVQHTCHIRMILRVILRRVSNVHLTCWWCASSMHITWMRNTCNNSTTHSHTMPLNSIQVSSNGLNAPPMSCSGRLAQTSMQFRI